MINIVNKYEALRLKIRRAYINKTYVKRRKEITCTDFTIISNNCWGGTVYQSYGLEYNSPTVGLFFMADDYIKFVYNIHEYMEKKLEFIDYRESKKYKAFKQELKYPIARLGDIEVYFMHYKTKEEALEKWERRKKRINWNKILYKFSNQNLCTEEDLIKFMKLPVKNKICFTNYNSGIENIIFVKQLFKTKDIKASYEPFGNHKQININNIINNLG